MTFYDVLGVAPDASPAAIRRAYVALARQYHPDFHTKATDGVRAANERAMQAVNEAWTVLSDPAARERYDDRYLRRTEPDPEVRRARAQEDARARAAWRPFDDDGDDDDIDPRLLDDEPARVEVSRSRQIVTVLPTIAFFAGVLVTLVGFVINLLPLALLGVVGIVLAALGFLVLPLLALSASARNDRR